MKTCWVGALLLVLVCGSTLLSAQVSTRPRSENLPPLKLLETAHTLFVQGDFPRARAYYLKALPYYPQNFDALKNLGYCFFSMGPRGFTSAAKYYARAYKINPNSPDVADYLTRCYMGLKRYGEAATIYRQMAAQPQAPPDTLKKAAEAYDLARRPPEAEAAYEAYLNRHPDDLPARASLGRLYSWDKKNEKAQAQFRVVLSVNPNFSPALVGMGRVLAWQGRLDESLELYDRALRIDPKNDEAKAGKAFSLLWMGRLEESRTLFTLLRQRHPQDTEVARGLRAANAAIEEKTLGPAQRAGDSAQIESYYRQRLAEDPSDLAAIKILAGLASGPKRCAEGIKLSRRALEISPDDPALELTFGRSLASCGQYTEAVPHYRRFLDFQPKAEDALYESAEALLRAGRPEEAAKSFRDLLRLNPKHADARVGLARALTAGGQYDEAMREYDEALESSPENYDALQGKAFLLYFRGRFAEARAIFKNLAAKQPKDAQNAEALRNIARAEEEARWTALRPTPGAPTQAFLNYFQQRLASYPNDQAALKGLADTQVQLKNNQAAIEAYQRVTELNPDDRDSKLELARLLSVEGQFSAATLLYREALKARPDDLGTLEKLARAYESAGQDRDALDAYSDLLAQRPADFTYKLEVARLRMRLNDYRAAREVLASLLSANPQSREARLGLAQIDVAEQRWDDAEKNFDGLLRQDARDPDALLGKAQVCYYQGKLRLAQATAAALVRDRPDNFDALFLLASIERAREHRREALRLLDRAARLSPNNPEVLEMRRKIREESAVTLHLSTSYAREIGAPTEVLSTQGISRQGLPSEDLRVYSYTSKIDFSFLPRTDSYLTFNSSPSDSPPGPLRNSQGQQMPTGITGAVGPSFFLYRQSTRASSHLTIRAGAGLVRFGPGSLVSLPGQPNPVSSAEARAIGQTGITIAPSRKFSLDFNADRAPIMYTPVSVKFGVIADRLEGGMNFFFPPWAELHMSFYHEHYSTKEFSQCFAIDGVTSEGPVCHDQSNGGSTTFSWNMFRSDALSYDAGYNGLAFGFAGPRRQVFLGFFNPRFYQRHLLTQRFYGKLGGAFGYELSGGAGPQQILQGRALTLAWNISPTLTLKASPRLTISLGYAHYNTAQALGSLRGNAVRLATDWRF